MAIAVPLQAELSGTEIPEAQDVLDVWPARVLAIVGNSLGTLAVVVVEASEQSGSLITARCALEQGRGRTFRPQA